MIENNPLLVIFQAQKKITDNTVDIKILQRNLPTHSKTLLKGKHK